ncbi:hypothetical protein JTE90_004570 [Oedothorax gibbosus]|uniref:Uncharacterized protein n=1 Tax=Oedothorax gibbosus TaxID=931172 RepID=A0AAV6UKR2_9ARAC|nr:hypothetical protein JTE90_004570 [Oedothorax gibbosus]
MEHRSQRRTVRRGFVENPSKKSFLVCYGIKKIVESSPSSHAFEFPEGGAEHCPLIGTGEKHLTVLAQRIPTVKVASSTRLCLSLCLGGGGPLNLSSSHAVALFPYSLVCMS